MPRRSARLRAKPKVDMGEDSLFYRALGFGKDKWNDLVQTVADDPPPQQKPWQRKQLFQPKPEPVKKKKPVLTRSRIEVDQSEVDFSRADLESAQARVDRIEVPEQKVKETIVSDNISKKRKHLLFMNPRRTDPDGDPHPEITTAPPPVGDSLPIQPRDQGWASHLVRGQQDSALRAQGREAGGRQEAVLRSARTGDDPADRLQTLHKMGEYQPEERAKHPAIPRNLPIKQGPSPAGRH